jgi:hypothetical protein
VGPSFRGVRVGQRLEDIQARFGDKVEFSAEYRNATSYSVNEEGQPSVGFTVDTQGIVRRVDGSVQSPSRARIDAFVDSVIAGTPITRADFRLLEDSPDLLRNLSPEMRRERANRQQFSLRYDVDPGPGLTMGFMNFYAYDRNPEAQNNAILSVAERSFDPGPQLYDRFRDNDIDILHFAKVALAADGRYRNFHGLYAPMACDPENMFAAMHRYSQVAFWSDSQFLYMRVFGARPGEFSRLRILQTYRENLEIDGRNVRAQMFTVVNDGPNPGTPTRMGLAEMPEFTRTLRMETGSHSYPAGGRFLIFGALLRRCPDSRVNEAEAALQPQH